MNTSPNTPSHHTPQRAEKLLSNGLTVLVEELPSSKSVSLGYFVHTGSRDETPEESGISHFLEHMMFKGTARRSALDITYALGNLAAHANAFTSDEMTVYYASVLPKYFPAMQELLTDMLRPALAQDEFDMEKKVILEEIALYQDRPTFYLFEHAMRDFFAGHSAGNSVLGSTESVSAISSGLMRAYFERRYCPSNMCLVVTGNVKADPVLAAAQELSASWARASATRELAPHKFQSCNKIFRKEGVAMAHSLYMSPSAPVEDEKGRDALSLLSVILGDSTGSKLYWDLVDPGIAESAGADAEDKEACGMFSVYASYLPERRELVLSKLQAAIKNIGNFSEEDLERAKTKMLSSTILEGELPLGRMMAIGSEWTYRKRFHDLDQDIAKLKAINKKTILETLERYPLQDWSLFELQGERQGETGRG